MQQNHQQMDLDELRNRHQWQEIIQNQSLHNIWLLEAHIELDSLTPQHNPDFLKEACESFKNDPDMAQYLEDMKLIYGIALVKFGKTHEAMRHFQRIDLKHFPKGSRRATLIAELLFKQAQHFKINILGEFPSGCAAWDFVYRVIKKLYSEACLLLGHAVCICSDTGISRLDVLGDSILKRELGEFICEREELFEIIPLEELHGFLEEDQNDIREQHEHDNEEEDENDNGEEDENDIGDEDENDNGEEDENVKGYRQTFTSIAGEVNDLKLELLEGFSFSLNKNLIFSQTTWNRIITKVSGSTGSNLPGRLGRVLIKNYGDDTSPMYISEFCFIDIIKKMLMMDTPQQDGNEVYDV